MLFGFYWRDWWGINWWEVIDEDRDSNVYLFVEKIMGLLNVVFWGGCLGLIMYMVVWLVDLKIIVWFGECGGV